MLIETLKRGARALFGRQARQACGTDAPPQPSSLAPDALQALSNWHAGVLYGTPLLGELPFGEMCHQAWAETGRAGAPFELLRELQSCAYLVRYFLTTLDIPGSRAACGAGGDAAALLLCRAARTVRGAFDGEGFCRIDCGPAVDVTALAQFPAVTRLEGPALFARPGPDETRWAFVHLAIPEEAMAAAALSYFHPRVAQGGVLVADGYDDAASGLRPAWEKFCDAANVPYLVLDSGQAVIWRQ